MSVFFILKASGIALILSARDMDKKERKRYGKNSGVTTISQASTYEEIAEFWDTHSGADYEDQMVEVEMTISPAARHSYVPIEADLMQTLRRIAQEQRVSPETLINVWLQRQVDGLRQETPLPMLRESKPK